MRPQYRLGLSLTRPISVFIAYGIHTPDMAGGRLKNASLIALVASSFPAEDN